MKRNVNVTAVMMAAGLAASLTGLAAAQSGGQAGGGDQYSTLPATMPLTGMIRDFRERTATGGHADFERQPTGGFGHYMGIVADTLGQDRKPVYASPGFKVISNYRDKAGLNRLHKDYIASLPGDTGGSISTTPGGAVTSGETLNQWFRDISATNLAMPLTLTLNRQPGTNRYVFDDTLDPAYKQLGGFFPINGKLFGNSGGSTPTTNFHFTFDLETSFTYKKNSGQVFTFTGDDDVWVFIDNKLVIDIGGVHSKVSQSINLDRLSWLADGKDYKLNFFFAERHRTQSNFRIETNIEMRTVEKPKMSGIND